MFLFDKFCKIIYNTTLWKPPFTVEFSPFCRRLMVKKDGCLPINPASAAKGGVYVTLSWEIFTQEETIHMIFSFIDICTILGAIVGIISLAMYFHDKRK